MEKKKQKKNYLAPECEIVQVSESTYLMEASMPGQHKKANHATGPAGANASQWGEENFENEASTSWEH